MDDWQASDKWTEGDVLSLEASLWILLLLDYIRGLETRIEALENP